MKRSKLYEGVWSKPMTKLGAELGISDVGLAKACRRHAIPVQPLGHWAKVQAGKASPKVPLPQAELDIEVSFTTAPPAQRQADVVRQREAKAVVAEKTVALRAAVPVRKEVDQRPHPLVGQSQQLMQTFDFPRGAALAKSLSGLTRQSN